MRKQQMERQRQINENLLRVRQLQQEMKYDEVLQVLDQILFLDENNPAALTLKDAIEQTRLYMQYRESYKEKEAGLANLRLEVLNSMIPPQPNFDGPGMRSTTGVMQYPPDWPGITQRRFNESGYQESPADRTVFNKLTTTSVPIDFQNNTFEQVVNYLSNVTGVKIYVDWKALDLIGISRDEEVNLQLDEVPADTALDRILEQVGGGFDKPEWAVDQGILTISSDEAPRKRVVTIVYDIRDLLFEVPYFDNAPKLDLDTALEPGQQPGRRRWRRRRRLRRRRLRWRRRRRRRRRRRWRRRRRRSHLRRPRRATPTRLSREELVQQIVDIIQENVDPEGWRDLGGDTGSLQELNGNLIITNTRQATIGDRGPARAAPRNPRPPDQRRIALPDSRHRLVRADRHRSRPVLQHQQRGLQRRSGRSIPTSTSATSSTPTARSRTR